MQHWKDFFNLSLSLGSTYSAKHEALLQCFDVCYKCRNCGTGMRNPLLNEVVSHAALCHNVPEPVGDSQFQEVKTLIVALQESLKNDRVLIKNRPHDQTNLTPDIELEQFQQREDIPEESIPLDQLEITALLERKLDESAYGQKIRKGAIAGYFRLQAGGVIKTSSTNNALSWIMKDEKLLEKIAKGKVLKKKWFFSHDMQGLSHLVEEEMNTTEDVLNVFQRFQEVPVARALMRLMKFPNCPPQIKQEEITKVCRRFLRGQRKRNPHKYWTEEELKAFRDHVFPFDEHVATTFWWLYVTACRIGELPRLKQAITELGNGTIIRFRPIKRATKDRCVAIDDEFLLLHKEIIGDPKLFRRKLKHCTRGFFKTKFQSHDIRTSRLTTLFLEDNSAEQLQQWIGHTSLQTTLGYIKEPRVIKLKSANQ